MDMQERKGTRWFWMASALWFAGLAAAFGLIALEDGRAGAQGTAPQVWPAESTMPAHDGRPTLVMFLHPHCPCSSASLGEFERMIAQLDNATLMIAFVKPEGTPQGWEDSGLMRRARGLPGVTILIDEGGTESRRFGARTSGHLVVYGATGELTFQGGITSARGHEGDNVGRQGALAGARGAASCCAGTEVFGCSLDDEECNER